MGPAGEVEDVDPGDNAAAGRPGGCPGRVVRIVGPGIDKGPGHLDKLAVRSGDEHIQAVEQPGSGPLRTILMRDQKDPDQLYTLVVFESEDKARAREQDPRRQEGLQAVQAILADILAKPPEFVDLAVIEEWTG